MNALLNDVFRDLIACTARVSGALLTWVHRIRIRFFEYDQRRLNRRYGISDNTPILSYGKDLESLINKAASNARGPVRFPITSGSTGAPKRVLFTKPRLRLLKLIFTDFFVRCCWALSIPRTSLYLFSSFSVDETLTSMLLEEKGLPSYLSTLQAPYRVQHHAALKALASEYGVNAVRLWILTHSNPGVLYSTNPSTISTFFDDLKNNWESNARLVREWQRRPDMFDTAIRRVARRIASVGCNERLEAVATSVVAPSIEVYAPAVRTYMCWTGGYVKPFLDRLEKHLPAPRYRLIPMYSMSTETVETIGHVSNGALRFLPMAPGVMYEFVEEGSTSPGAKLLKPKQLQPGRSYSLVVSDAYGLRRYDTGDVFLCRQKILDLPDLVFLRRRNLEYSFTGEKLTAEQIVVAFEQLRESTGLQQVVFLTCIPSHPAGKVIPHYKLVLVSEEPNGFVSRYASIETTCDKLFANLNCEYKSKRETKRLGSVQLVKMNQADFVNLTSNGSRSQSWETQFKFLPLYVQTWEAMNSCSRHHRH